MFQLIEAIFNRKRMEAKRARIDKVLNDPQQRLRLLEQAYKKFSADLTDHERKKMKKEMKKLKKKILTNQP
jgi:hypothetical protein